MTSRDSESAKALWEKFLMLIKETDKFFDADDVDMAMEVIRQSLVIFERIDKLEVDDFKGTPEGSKLLEELKPIFKRTQFKAMSWLNKSRNRNKAIRSYTEIGGINPNGYVFNKKS